MISLRSKSRPAEEKWEGADEFGEEGVWESGKPWGFGAAFDDMKQHLFGMTTHILFVIKQNIFNNKTLLK